MTRSGRRHRMNAVLVDPQYWFNATRQRSAIQVKLRIACHCTFRERVAFSWCSWWVVRLCAWSSCR
jgi:hypothetical protein